MRVHSEITLNVITRIDAAYFAASRLDASIEFGGAERSGLNAVKVMNLVPRPCAASGMAKQHRNAFKLGELAQTFTQHTAAPESLPRWFDAAGVRISGNASAMRLDLMSIAPNAAAAGLSAVLLPDFMVADALVSRKVVRLSARAWTPERACHLVSPEAMNVNGPLWLFRPW